MASNETREDGSTATQRLRAMESARPTMSFPRSGPNRFVQRFMKEMPGAIESARTVVPVAGGAMAQPGSSTPVDPAPTPLAQPASIAELRHQYAQLKHRNHDLTVEEVEELQSILLLEEEA